MSSTFPLNNLPFDILLQLIELLDHGDIYSLCLVSRGFDSIATPVLYRTLKWDEEAGFTPENHIYRPCLAFRRRPFLRKHVQSVTLSFSKKPYHWGIGVGVRVPEVQSICKELSLLPSLYELGWSKWQSSDTYQLTLDLVIDTVAKLPSIRKIHIPFSTPLIFSPLTQKFNGISIRLSKRLDLVTEWLEKQQKHLQELHIVAWNGSKFALSNNFRALRRFSQDRVTEVPAFMAGLREMNQLEELSIGIRAWPVIVQPAKLSKLQSLKIECHEVPYEAFAEATLYCYESIGTYSPDLQTVHICATSPQGQFKKKGDRLVSKMINNHATSIRDLRLDDMTATNETLMRLLSRCPRLEELGIAILKDADVTLSTLSTLVPLYGTFQSLNVVMAGFFPLHNLQKVEAFLLQAMPSLRRISIWLYGWLPAGIMRPGARCISWERRWIYDGDLCVRRQCITVTPEYDSLWRDKN